jgi:AraC-like DNA-binding protein
MHRAAPLLHGQSIASERGVVLALVVGAAERARIQEALRGRHTVQFTDHVDAMERHLGSLHAHVVLLIVESHDADRRSTADSIRFVRQAQPNIAIVGYCKAGIAHSSDVRALALAGVHELLFHGIDDNGTALRAILAMAQQAMVGDVVASTLLPLVAERLWQFVRYVVSHPAESSRVARVAQALGYHRKTLVNHCARAHLPPPQELLAWCRLAVVGYLLQTTKSTVEGIAFQLDFPSDTSLRNLMKRYVGMRSTDVRAAGGLAAVVAAFERALVAIRMSKGRTG